MSWMPAAISAGANLLGASISSNAARGAADTSAAASLEAARLAAEAQKFRPVGITSRFGTSNFQFDPSGYLTGAGYTLSPELQAMQDQIMGYTRQSLGDVATAQNLARGYLAQTPEQAAQQWMSNQQGLLRPGRELQRAQLMNSMFNKGTGGLAVAQGGNLAAANPEMQAYYNAIAQQDLGLAAQADQYGRERVNYGLGLLSSAYSPFQTGLGLGQTIEQLGQTPLDIGAQLGGRSATAGANVGQSLLSGGLNAAKIMQSANAFSPLGTTLMGLGQNQNFSAGLANWLGSDPLNLGRINPRSGEYMGSLEF